MNPMNVNYISPNLTIILKEILDNQILVKWLQYDDLNPLAQPDVTNSISLMFDRVFPYPFDAQLQTEDATQLRVYTPLIYFSEDETIAGVTVNFDIVCAKRTLWLANTGSSVIRPIEIMKEIIRTFRGKTIGTVGKLKFERATHLYVNDQFDLIRLEAEMFTIGR